MREKFIGIPFKVSSEHGISEFSGLAKFSRAGIVIEFEQKYLGLIETGVKEIGIPLNEILDIRFKKGFFKFGAKIEVYLNNFAKLSALPNKNGRFRLGIAREFHARAEEAVQNIRNFLEMQNSAPADEKAFQSVAPRSLFDKSEDETRKLP